MAKPTHHAAAQQGTSQSRNGGRVVLTPQDMTNPHIRAWLAEQERVAAVTKRETAQLKILNFASKVLGQRVATLTALTLHLRPLPQPSGLPRFRLSPGQLDMLRLHAPTDLGLKAIASKVGCSWNQARDFYRACPRPENPASLAKMAQKVRLRELAPTAISMWDIAREVGCSYETVKTFYRRHSLRAHRSRAPKAPRLTLAQKAMLVEYSNSDLTTDQVAAKVGCSHAQARDFLLAERKLRT